MKVGNPFGMVNEILLYNVQKLKTLCKFFQDKNIFVRDALCLYFLLLKFLK